MNLGHLHSSSLKELEDAINKMDGIKVIGVTYMNNGVWYCHYSKSEDHPIIEEKEVTIQVPWNNMVRAS